MTEPTEREKVSENSSEKKRSRRKMLYPRRTINDVLKVAYSIKRNNNMRPFNRIDLARSLSYSPNSSLFKSLITYSAAYGFTSGSYSSDSISLTSLGVMVVSPKSESERGDALRTALFQIPFLKTFFTNFNQGTVPKGEYLLNTLTRVYGIPPEECNACFDITMKIARELGILVNIKGNDYIQLDKLSSNAIKEEKEEEPEKLDVVNGEETEQLTSPKESSDVFNSEKSEKPNASTFEKPRVFISHSRNKKIVEQIETILKFGQFDYENAEERETIAIPISEKVFGLMKDCNCAIINLSVDEQEVSAGEYKLNSNVLIEIGAAFLQYDRRVILLVDRRLSAQLPSNLNGLYRCEYQGDELSFETAMKLQEALTEFREDKPKKGAISNV